MREKMDDKLTVPIASSISKKLYSRDSAERLVRTAVSLWRERPGGHNKPVTLILDFSGISELSESAADVLVGFRFDFSGGKYPLVQFSNTSTSVKKALTAAEKAFSTIRKGINAREKKKRGFMIEI